MKKSIIFSALTVAGMIAAPSANAALTGTEVLGINLGDTQCLIFATANGCHQGLTKVVSGSYFAMDTNGSGTFDQPERVAIGGVSPSAGLDLGSAGQGNGEIDLDWSFGNNLGRHNTTGQGTTPSVLGNGNVDMSGWTVYWGAGGAADVDINMGAGPGEGVIACTSGTMTCASGETYTLDYETVVPAGQPFENVPYQLHLEGTVNPVPVPAAVWLFGSGLLGLVGVARRRKAA